MNKQLLTKTPKSPMAKATRLVELEKQIKTLTEEKDELKADLLKVTQDLDVLTLKTGSYTISRAKRITPQVLNIPQLKASLDMANIPYDMVEAFADHMKVTFKALIDSGKQLDGLEGRVTEYITVRVNDK